MNGRRETGDVPAGGITVVLASSSPRRRELLGLIGIVPEVIPPDIPEIWREGEAPRAYVERLAREKAAAVATRRPEALVIAADTTVAVDDGLLEKPRDADEAAGMLRRLSGRAHEVHTAIAVMHRGRVASGVESTKVWLHTLDDDTIRDYLATGESMDKAGAYGIQGFGAVLVEKIAGDYFTVMGLGLRRLTLLMRELGVTYRFGSLTIND